MIIVGIDPGLTGAIAVIESDIGGDGIYSHFVIDVFDIPVEPNGNGKVKNRVHAAALDDILQLVEPHLIILEKQMYRPVFRPGSKKPAPAGGSSTFSLGDTYGVIRTCCALTDGEVKEISPTVWKKSLGLGKNKRDSIDLSQTLYPEVVKLPRPVKLVKHHNRAEAVLLAHYGVQMYNEDV